MTYTHEECYECQEHFSMEELTETVNGYVCNECLKNYTRCDECGEWVPVSETYPVLHEEYWRGSAGNWCEVCVDHKAYQCADCGEFFAEPLTQVDTHIRYGGYHLCRNCMDNNDIGICDRCGHVGDDVYYSERYEEDVCNECGVHHVIQGYSKTDSLVFIGESDELHMGIELEIDGGGNDDSCAKAIMEALGGYEYCECKEDGSLDDGFEIASAPATLKAHMETLNWKAAMKKALFLGYTSHSYGTCGLHVHVDRNYFERGKRNLDYFELKNEYEDKFAMLFANNVEWIKRFSRRTDYEYCEVTEPASRKTTPKEAKVKDIKARPDKRAKYNAINYNTYINTIEFRIFRGTLKYNTFVATLQFVQMFCDYVRDLDLEFLAAINEKSFLAKARDKGYEEFISYMAERGISAA